MGNCEGFPGSICQTWVQSTSKKDWHFMRASVPRSRKPLVTRPLPSRALISRLINPHCFAVGKRNCCAVTKAKTKGVTAPYHDRPLIPPNGKMKEHRHTCRKG